MKRGTRQGFFNSSSWIAILCSLFIIVSTASFLPGKSGPFIFDDYSNLIDNTYIKLTALEWDNVRQAAYSLEAGPLRRPIAMTSFALNYYFVGSFKDSAPYKITNIIIHAINGLLVFWFAYLVLSKLKIPVSVTNKSVRAVPLLAGAVALLWVVHPMHVSTVLYVVQRMTELSTLFTLLALISYLYARQEIRNKTPWALWLLIGGPLVFGMLGMLSKEIALLLPVFILLIEFLLYGEEKPWVLWHKLRPKTKRLLIFLTVIAAIALLIGAILYAMPTYASVRRFTMLERVLTETRVLFFYMSLLIVPQIHRFGHQHDDIAISTSILNPWTTLPAIVGHILLIGLAIRLRKRSPLVTFGILWFYAGHLLESTVFGLEIAYEHRNYLAMLGFPFVIIGLLTLAKTKLRWRRAYWLVPIAVLVFSGITTLRASQWGDPNAFYRYEVMHHPESARIQIGYSILLDAQGNYLESLLALRRAVELEPDEPGYWLQLHLSAARQNAVLPQADHDKTLELLRTKPLSATVILALQHTTGCLQSWCQSLQVPLENWINAILSRGKNTPHDKPFFYYLLGLTYATQGRVEEAIQQLRLSYDSDPSYVHPLFALANIAVQLGDKVKANQILEELRIANAKVSHPRHKELAELEKQIADMNLAYPAPKSNRHLNR